ncbi:hypothetical protein NDI54_05885 [Haloarcula sp. S1AR25-5A]|uniref:Uncharacterized protein n=1 Tax=Haloarcula terrestris TaxID=2950533 RepID=A0AAE4EWU1_9EURY|nr:hypothetical protein [Haloarcula terrestris]MDS0220884.1 hypothetical protein [Haloarcula terrestris]
MSGDLVRPADDADPDGVMDYISAVSDELPTDAGDVIALREMWYHLRVHGTVTEADLKDAGWDASEKLRRIHGTQNDWWTSTGKQYLALLPNVSPPGDATPWRRYLQVLPDLVRPSTPTGQWAFDEGGQSRPDQDADPATLTDEQLSAALDAVDVPGDIGRDRGRSTVPLRRMYRQIEQGSATTAELKDHYSTSRHDKPEQGHYQTAGAWFRAVGRPILASLPGIDPPRVVGEPWRFIGVEEAALQVDTTDDDGVDAALAALSIPGRGAWADRRREVIEQAYKLVRDEGSVSRSALVSRVDASDVGYESAEAFVDEVLADCLPELPGVESGESADSWRYRGSGGE